MSSLALRKAITGRDTFNDHPAVRALALVVRPGALAGGRRLR